MLDDLKANNRAWAAAKVAQDKGFFKRLVSQQAPQYLWIGCSDSRVPANEIVGLDRAKCSSIAMSPIWPRRRTPTICRCCNSRSMSSRSSTSSWSAIMVRRHRRGGRWQAARPGRSLAAPIREVAEQNHGELLAIADPHKRQDRLMRTECGRQVHNVASDVSCRMPGRGDRNLRPWLGLFPRATGW